MNFFQTFEEFLNESKLYEDASYASFLSLYVPKILNAIKFPNNITPFVIGIPNSKKMTEDLERIFISQHEQFKCINLERIEDIYTTNVIIFPDIYSGIDKILSKINSEPILTIQYGTDIRHGVHIGILTNSNIGKKFLVNSDALKKSNLGIDSTFFNKYCSEYNSSMAKK